MAGWEGEGGDPERAARLFLATLRLLEKHGLEIVPPEVRFHQADLEAIREKLGSDRFEMLAAEGRTMDLEAAIAYALNATSEER